MGQSISPVGAGAARCGEDALLRARRVGGAIVEPQIRARRERPASWKGEKTGRGAEISRMTSTPAGWPRRKILARSSACCSTLSLIASTSTRSAKTVTLDLGSSRSALQAVAQRRNPRVRRREIGGLHHVGHFGAVRDGLDRFAATSSPPFTPGTRPMIWMPSPFRSMSSEKRGAGACVGHPDVDLVDHPVGVHDRPARDSARKRLASSGAVPLQERPAARRPRPRPR
jgi:hypothetical protein